MAGGGPSNYMESSQLAGALVKLEELSIYSHPIRGRMRRRGEERIGVAQSVNLFSAAALQIASQQCQVAFLFLSWELKPVRAMQ